MNDSTDPEVLRKPKADLWFELGERLRYNYRAKRIAAAPSEQNTLCIWNRVIINNRNHPNLDWITMMPGFPDGSFGWATTEQHVSSMMNSNRLYLDYIGMGDSDKPKGYAYGVMERADMTEALWKYHEINDTILVTFDFSSLVALELLQRQITKLKDGIAVPTKIRGVLMINGGYFADSHSHPILTTPLLKTVFGRLGTRMAQKSSFAFNLMMKDLWSNAYGVSKEELAENQKAIGKRDGMVFMSDAAGFVDEHKRNSIRWDLKNIFLSTYPYVKFMVAGSEEDQFEPLQLLKARHELEHQGLIIQQYPGGHMTTSEYPHLIANSIKHLKTIS